MRVTIAAIGTRGDVQPMIALGKGLKAAGHDVAMIAGSNFGPWVSGHGLRFVPTVDMEALMSSEKGVAWSQGSDDPLKQLRMMRELMIEHGQGMIDPIHAAAASCDLLVSSFPAQPVVQAASEASGVPYVNAELQPLHPTRSGAAALNPLFPRGDSRVNRWMGRLADRMVWWIAAVTANGYRGRLGLPPHTSASFHRANRQARSIMGYSRHVVPPPPDWPAGAVVTGYWFLDEDEGWAPPDDLRRFLDAGPPPVYVGFGSVSHRDSSRTVDLIVEAARRSGQRALLAAGWGELGTASLPAEVHVIQGAPHRWLFPRMAGVVHHGGAGTTAAGLRAGRATFVVPHMSDQPYWGRRVFELGAGVKPVPRHKLTAGALAAAMARLAGDARIRDAADALGERIRAEHGVAAAVAAIGGVRSAAARSGTAR
jgi:UDP:flavonoid glycosyltransferase YjiC (YdhE family)